MTVTDAQVGTAMNALVTYYEAQGHTVRPESIDYQALRVALEAVLEPRSQQVRLVGPGWSRVATGEDWRFRVVAAERTSSGDWFFRMRPGPAWWADATPGSDFEAQVVPDEDTPPRPAGVTPEQARQYADDDIDPRGHM